MACRTELDRSDWAGHGFLLDRGGTRIVGELFLVDTMSSHCGVRFISSPTLVGAISQKIVDLATLTVPLVATVTLVLIPIPLVCNRSRFRRLARQPGLMALCTRVWRWR